jgi:four helix bundle protein
MRISVCVAEAFAPGVTPGLIVSEGSEHGSDREFRRFLIIANPSAAEVEAQALIAGDLDCLDRTTSDRIAEQCRYIGRMLNRLMARLDASG